ncbi:PE-PGRS family protein [Streptomyces sp. NPDC057257]|uniref:PE-PGRS family protein n=1 Tax=Streptomyces sp. NPDC057257 TaxID=3346071 RepID=UPI003624D3D4
MAWGRDKYAELLGRAGLEVVGEWRVEYVLPPRSAWRAAEAEEPVVVVSGGAPGEVNAEWHRLADQAGFFAGDGVFLIDVPGDWTWPGRLWTQVRLGGAWDLAGVLGTRFVTLSADGDALVGVTGGGDGSVGAAAAEDAVRLVAVGGIRERREEAVLAAVRETAEERAEAWAALVWGWGPGAGAALRGGEPGADAAEAVYRLPSDRPEADRLPSDRPEADRLPSDRPEADRPLSGLPGTDWLPSARPKPDRLKPDRPKSARQKPSASLTKDWADGLVGNPVTPDDARFGLLGKSRRLLQNPLPPAVLETAIAHPDWEVREAVAEFQPLAPEQWARLILGGQGERQRWILTMVAGNRRDEVAEYACRELAADPSTRIRAEAARLRGLPADVAVELAADPEPTVRGAACPVAWPHLDPAHRQALLADGEREVRLAALREHHKDHPVSLETFMAEGIDTGTLDTHPLERGLAEHLARNGAPRERSSLGLNPHLPPDLVALLAEDPDPGVRWAVSLRADLTEEQRAAIPVEIDSGGHYRELAWVVALHDDPEAMRRLAASSHPLVRRSVARARRLPPDVVERLARDEDRIVHLFLAESCDDAPADMLLSVWRWWTGSLSFPDRPRGHPNFPREGLLRYADDPNPRMRQLALDDPKSTPELVARMSRDPDPDVRHRAARDPRLTVADAVRLVDDPVDHIRHAAARHPDLPGRVLAALLFDPELARTAAGHPALPEEVVRWMAGQVC